VVRGEADNGGRGSKRQRGPGGGVARARRLGGGGKVGVRVWPSRVTPHGVTLVAGEAKRWLTKK